MYQEEPMGYTSVSVLIGLAVGLVLVLFFEQQTNYILSIYYSFFNVRPYPYGTIGIEAYFLVSALGVVGLSAIWVSLRFDLPKDIRNVLSCTFVVVFLLYFIVAWAIFSIILWSNSVLSENPSGSILKVLAEAALGIVGLIAMIPYVVFSYTITPISIGLFISGLLCVPRVLVFLFTVHPVRRVWDEGKDSGQFNAPELTKLLGKGSQSKTHARALKEDVQALTEEVRSNVEAVRAEKQKLSEGIEDDIERHKAEAELSRLMAEYEKMKIQIDVLSDYRKKELGRKDSK